MVLNEDGQYLSDSVEEILDVMVADAKEYFDEDLDESEYSTIRTFYRPIAIQFSQLQEDIAKVLEATQIDNANGVALDLLVSLIGITRESATKSEGELTFSREEASNTDYPIPVGTKAQTEGIEPIEFETTDSAILEGGATEVTVPVEAVEAGANANVSSSTITQLISPPTGIETVTNKSSMQGGIDREGDEKLRERAKEELAEGSRATQRALVRAVMSLPGVDSAIIYPNKEDRYFGKRPGFELVIEGGNESDIVEKINTTKAAGEKSYSGNLGESVSGTHTLSNGQVFTEEFSRPEIIPVYVDVSLTVTDEYAGDDFVMREIVNYIGGTTPSGNNVPGKNSVGDDVVYGEVEYAIRSVRGVYDVDSLAVSKQDPPSGEANISIKDFQVGNIDSYNNSITIST